MILVSRTIRLMSPAVGVLRAGPSARLRSPHRFLRRKAGRDRLVGSFPKISEAIQARYRSPAPCRAYCSAERPRARALAARAADCSSGRSMINVIGGPPSVIMADNLQERE